jgi:hypothetical protein
MEEMYDWNREKLVTYLDKNSENDYIYIEFTHKELNRSEAWFRRQCRELFGEKLKIDREILLKWTKASDTSPFTEEQLDAIDDKITEEIGTITLREYYTLHLVELLKRDKVYLIGGDIAGGLDRDDSTLVVVDPETGLPVAYLYNNKIDTDEYYNVAFELIEKWLPKSVFVPERNSYGLPIIQRWMKTKLEKNLFFHSREKAEKKVGQASSKSRVKVYGIDTSSKSRDLMIDILKKDVVENPAFFRMKKLYDQVRTLERNKNGKIEHSSNSHDDVLFGYLLCRYVMWYHNDILSKFFLKVNQEQRNASHMHIVASNSGGATEITELSQQIINQQINQDQQNKGGFRLGKKSGLMSIIDLNN